MTQRRFWSATAVTCLLLAAQACGGDDDDDAADSGTDHDHDHGKTAGKGGSGGKAGSSSKAGSGGSSGSAGKAPSGGAGGAGGSAGGGSSTQAVTIHFKAKLGDADLECGKSFPNLGKSKVSAAVQDFRFFVEEVSLIDGDGKAAKVVFDDKAPFQTKDVALIDFTETKGACASGGGTVNTSISGKVAPGEYKGIVFVQGVPETLNHQNITAAKPPLQDTTAYWGWQSGYRFIMSGLVVDEADRGASESDAGVSSGANFVHIGSGGCTGTGSNFTCTRPDRTKITLSDFDVTKDTIIADLAKAYEDVDLKDSIECHGAAPECGPVYTAFGLNIDTGATLDSQKVFRVE